MAALFNFQARGRVEPTLRNDPLTVPNPSSCVPRARCFVSCCSSARWPTFDKAPRWGKNSSMIIRQGSQVYAGRPRE